MDGTSNMFDGSAQNQSTLSLHVGEDTLTIKK